MTLKEQLISQILVDGPVSVASYMQICLLHPEHGYYATRDPFGAAGDFTTAPEISQMFGELLGLCLVQSWMDQGSPASPILAEIGPGRGTLMRDMIRATRKIAAFKPDLHLIEASATLRDVQADTLEGNSVTWHDTIDQLPDGPLFLIANEFFDALPIRQFVRQGPAWAERKIGLSDGELSFGLAPPSGFDFLSHRLADTKDGDIVEYCPAAQPIMTEISARITRFGGAALIIDYGGWRSLGDTFQAIQNHEPCDPLADPGNADLTAHVDFENLAAVCECTVSRMTTQGVLLESLGITQRARALASSMSGDVLEQHISAHRRLTHPSEMGTLFKAIALSPAPATLPPGFAP